MTEVMFAFQMTGPQERKAIEAWVADKGEDFDIVAELPKLKVGHPHVWSPQWLQISRKVHIARKQTFDASATPEFGSREAERKLTPVDVVAIREAMQDMITQAEAEDPTMLKREIARLRKELKAAQSAQPAPVKDIERVEVPVISDNQADMIKSALGSLLVKANEVVSLGENMKQFAEVMNNIMITVTEKVVEYGQASKPVVRYPANNVKGQATINREMFLKPEKGTVSNSNTESITNPMQRILDAIAWLESIGIDTPRQVAVAFLANYSYGGGAFNNPRSALRSAGLVEYVGECIRLTDEGRKHANYPETPLTVEELQRHVMSVLPGPHQKILQVLIDNYHKGPITKDQCAALAGYAPGGAFNNPLGRLRSMGLVDYPRPGYVVAESLLFLE